MAPQQTEKFSDRIFWSIFYQFE